MEVHIIKYRNSSGNYFDNTIPIDFGDCENFLYQLHIWDLNTASVPNYPIDFYYFAIEWLPVLGGFKVRVYYADAFGFRPTYFLMESILIESSEIEWTIDNSSKYYRINLNRDINGSFGLCGSLMFHCAGTGNHLITRHISILNPLNVPASFIDYIQLQKIPKDFISDLSERFLESERISYSAGILQLKLKYYLDSEQSDESLNLKEFLSDTELSDIFHVVITDSGEIVRSGFVDLDTIKIKETTEVKGDIEFDVDSPDGMLSKLTLDFNKINGTYSFRKTYSIQNWNEFMTQAGNVFGVNIIDLTNIESDYEFYHGHKPYIENPSLVWDPINEVIVVKGILSFLLAQQNILAIEFFFELLSNAGAIYKLYLNPVEDYRTLLKYDLKLLKREGQNEVEGMRILKNGIEKTRSNLINAEYWGLIFIKYEFYHWDYLHMFISNGTTKKTYVVVEKPDVYVCFSDYNENWIDPLIIDKENVHILNTKFYATPLPLHHHSPSEDIDWTLKEISPVALFDHTHQRSVNDWFPYFDYQSWGTTLKDKYGYLLPGRKTQYNLKVKFDKLQDFLLHNYIYVNNLKHTISEISSINLRTKNAEVKVFEE